MGTKRLGRRRRRRLRGAGQQTRRHCRRPTSARTLYRSSPAAAATDTRRHAPYWLSTSGTRAFLVFVLVFAILETFVVLYVLLCLCVYIF